MATPFSELLRTYRKSMGWTQEEMSQNWSYSFETISAWERGKRSPNSREIPRLAKLLKVDAEELAATIMNSREQLYSPDNNLAEYHETGKNWKTGFEVWGELQHIYRTRTEFNRGFSYASMFENAHSIIATGVSLNAIALIYSRDMLLKTALEQGCRLQLCFLDPTGKNCAEREEEEGYPEGILASLTTVNIHLMKILRCQIEKMNMEQSKQVEIRVYDMIPRFNIYVVDDILMTVQSYGYGRGEDTPTLVLKRKTQGGLFDFYVSIAKHILDHSTDISHTTTVEDLLIPQRGSHAEKQGDD